MICASPIIRGPRKGEPATGTTAGYYRHRYAGEPACPACLAGHSKESTARHRARQKKRRNASPAPAPSMYARSRNPMTGGVPVVCSGCGARGLANRALVGRARKIPSCANCREAA